MPNKIVIEIIGRTYLIPTSAVFSFNNAVIDIFAPDFKISVEKADIQEIYLLDSKNASEYEIELLRKLPPIGSKNKAILSKISKVNGEQEEPKKKKLKKKIELRSGVI